MAHTHFGSRLAVYQEKVSPATQAFLPPELAELVEDTLHLFTQVQTSSENYNDYAFVLFPLAKAYEGFLKIYFFQLGIVHKDVYHARHFRIGRSFNPDLAPRLRDESWLYDDVARLCSPDLANELWQVWLEARNHLFHFFPGDRYVLTLDEANQLIGRVLSAMDQALSCKPHWPRD